MTIIDALISDDLGAEVRVCFKDRWMVGCLDTAESEPYFVVYEQKPRQRHARCLTETSNEDEACRWLIGEKG